MNINNNSSSIQNPNSALSFRAALKTDLPVKDLKRFANIQDLFAKKTQHYASDVVSLTKSKDKSFAEFTVLAMNKNNVSVGDYKYSHIIDSIDSMMDKMTDNQIVKKFINYFKMMKKEEQFDKSVVAADKTIEHLTAVRDKNLFVARRCSESGNQTLAAKYDTIAKSVKDKLDSVMYAHEAEKAKILSDMDKIAKNEPELNFVSDTYGSPV